MSKGLKKLEAWLLSLREDDPAYYCGFELDFGMDRSQVLDKIHDLLQEDMTEDDDNLRLRIVELEEQLSRAVERENNLESTLSKSRIPWGY